MPADSISMLVTGKWPFTLIVKKQYISAFWCGAVRLSHILSDTWDIFEDLK